MMRLLRTLSIAWVPLSIACSDDAATGSGGSGTGGTTTTGDTTSANSGANGTTSGFETGASTGTTMGCNPETYTLKQSPAPEVYLVVDRSGSMNLPGATPMKTRWEELKDAVDAALAQYESSIHFGLIMYPSGNECGTSGPQVLFDKDGLVPINAQLNATTPAGGTPTAAALNNAAASLNEFGSMDAPKFLILATDGGPNCNYFLESNPTCTCTDAMPEYCCTNYPGTCLLGSFCLDDAGTLGVLTALRGQGIDSFIIGLAGTESYKALLDRMAEEGGRPQMNAPTKFYDASNEAALLAALQSIAVSVLSCEIDLGMAPKVPDAVTVYVDGVEVPRDENQVNGWDYTDNTNVTIKLFGPACDAIQDGDEHDVTATFDCEVE
jgi:hypothetical protein